MRHVNKNKKDNSINKNEPKRKCDLIKKKKRI